MRVGSDGFFDAEREVVSVMAMFRKLSQNERGVTALAECFHSIPDTGEKSLIGAHET